MKETNVTEFGTVLTDAIESKKNDITQLMWIDKTGNEIPLVSMNNYELQKVYNHVCEMLWNSDKYTPGRIQVKQNIKDLVADCNAELLRRYFLHDCEIKFFTTNLELVDFLRIKKNELNLKDTDTINNIFTNLPKEFETVTIEKLMQACFDKLNVINRKMISDRFILAQGIWLTNAEKNELTEKDSSGNRRNFMDVVKERLLLPDIKLRVSPNGFSYSEFKSLVRLDVLTKISDLTVTTLRLLRDKVFLRLDSDTDYHIAKWMTLKTNIEKVADYNRITLQTKVYEN